MCIPTRAGRQTHLLQLADIKEKFGRDRADAVGSTPDEFARFIRAELEKWSKAGCDAGIEPKG